MRYYYDSTWLETTLETDTIKLKKDYGIKGIINLGTKTIDLADYLLQT